MVFLGFWVWFFFALEILLVLSLLLWNYPPSSPLSCSPPVETRWGKREKKEKEHETAASFLQGKRNSEMKLICSFRNIGLNEFSINHTIILLAKSDTAAFSNKFTWGWLHYSNCAYQTLSVLMTHILGNSPWYCETQCLWCYELPFTTFIQTAESKHLEGFPNCPIFLLYFACCRHGLNLFCLVSHCWWHFPWEMSPVCIYNQISVLWSQWICQSLWICKVSVLFHGH